MRLLRGGAGAVAIGTLAWMLVAAPRLAAAGDADELIREGIALRRGGDDAAALERFQRAFRIDQSAVALAQIGLAEQALGRWVMAYEHLSRSLESTSDAWIKKNRATIKDSLGRAGQHVGQLEILGGSPGAEVRIDGTPRGKLPLAHPLAVPTGTITVELAAPGFNPVQRFTIVHARETTREAFDALTALPARSRAMAPAPAPAEPMASASRVPSDAPAESHKPAAIMIARDNGDTANPGGEKAGPLRRSVKWVAWGVGAASLAVGILGYVRQNQAGDQFASGGCAIGPSGDVVTKPDAIKMVADCRSFKSQLDSNYRLELGGLIGAAALAATGLVLWLTEPSAAASSVEAQTATLACSPGVTAGRGPWLGCRLAF